jgi:hypothetical protein
MANGRKSPEQRVAEKAFVAFRNEWLKQVAADASLPVSAYRVAVFIALEHLNWASRLAWPSYATLTQALGAKGDKTAVSAVAALIESGHLVIAVPGQKGRGKSNHYAPVIKAGKPPLQGGFSDQENLPAGEGFASQENLPVREPKTFPHGKVNTYEHIPLNAPHPGSGEGGSESAPPVPEISDADIAAIAAEIVAIFPPRPNSTRTPSESIRRELARAFSRGAKRDDLLRGAERTRRYAAGM